MGITKAKGGTKTKAAFLKAIGYIIPLMDAEYAGYYTREVMPEVTLNFIELIQHILRDALSATTHYKKNAKVFCE